MSGRKRLIGRSLLGLAAVLAVVSGAAAAAPRPGSLDGGFGDGGRLSGQIGCMPLSVAGVERAEHGGFRVVGSTERSSPDLGVEGGRLIVRGYTRSGRLDRDVGGTGTVLVPLPGGHARAWDVTRQRDGKLVVVGSVGEAFPDPNEDLFVARFFPDGSLDGEFGNGGVAITDLGGLTEEGRAVVVQPDGRLVVAASVRYPGSAFGDPSTDLIVVRYGSDGKLDPSFASGGVLHVPPDSGGAYFFVAGVALTRDGTILVGGDTGLTSRDSNVASIARVRGDGSLDRVVRFAGDWTDLSSMTLDRRRGRLYLAGTTPRNRDASEQVMYLAAVGAQDLRLQGGFGSRGFARADLPRTSYDFPAAVISVRRGRVVLAGGAAGAPPRSTFGPVRRSRFAVARFTAAGKLDRRFGRRGVVRVGFPYRQSVAQAVIEQPRGRLVVAGIAAGRSQFLDAPSGCVLAVARLGDR